MVRNYVRRDVRQPDRITDKVLEAGVQTSYVHSSKNNKSSRTAECITLQKQYPTAIISVSTTIEHLIDNLAISEREKDVRLLASGQLSEKA